MAELTQEELANMTPEQIQELQKKNCIFCHIVNGRVQSRKVYEDDLCITILDINPANPGHVLIIPKEHFMILPQVPDDVLGRMFMVSKAMSNVLLKALKIEGTNIFIANGALAGQKAQHAMFHVIPRKEGDGVDFKIPQHGIMMGELRKVHDRLLPKIKELFKFDDEKMKKLGHEIEEEKPEPKPEEKKEEEKKEKPKEEKKPKKETKKAKQKKSKPKKMSEEEQKQEIEKEIEDEGIDLDTIADMFK